MKQLLEYRLLDSGCCRKLEQAGPYRIIRPALNAFWKPHLPESEWNKADAVFTREASGGIWDWKNRRPEEWNLSWGGLVLLARPTNFGHLGFFAEQAPNWQWMRDCVKQMPSNARRTLNMFAYSGGATLAMASAGAEACHLDASKGIIDWAKKNQALNPGTEHIRWICDDALKFAAREARRNSLYNGIILDPPSFGRGAQGQVWKIEEGLEKLLKDCRAIMDRKNPHFILLSCHSPGFSPIVLGRCLADVFPEEASAIECGEMKIPEGDGTRFLPAGIYARFFVR